MKAGTIWDVGEQFTQRIALPGLSQAHTLVAGVYDPDTGQRITATRADGRPWPDAAITLKP